MATNFNRNYAFAGPDVELDVGLTAVTAVETPQIFLSWVQVPEFIGGFRIVRRQRHYAKDENDGLVVYSYEGVPPQKYYSDTLIRPETFYYYQIFFRVDTVWYKPKNGQAWAYSGTDWWFEDSEQETTIFSNPNGSITESYLATNGTEVGITDQIFSVGDWALVGETDPKYVLVTATSLTDGIVKPHKIYFERVGVVKDSTAWKKVERAGLKFVRTNSGFSSKSTIQRSSGNFVEDGYRAKMVVRIRGSRYNDGDFVLDGVYPQVLVFAANSLIDEGPTSAAYILGPPGNIGGERVKKVFPRSSFLAYKVYQHYLPDSMRSDDSSLNQGAVLSTTTLTRGTRTSGQKANLGVPGYQLGLQRWIRALLLEFDRARSAIHALPSLYDIEDSPVEFLRLLASMYAVQIPDTLDASQVRTLVRSQPHLVRRRGRADEMLALFVDTTSVPINKVMYGKDMVVRIGELASGFVWDGRGIVSSVTSSTLTDTSANFPVNGLVGYRLHPNNNPSVEDRIVSNTATTIQTSGALDLSSVTSPGSTYFVNIPYRGNEGWQTSFYDPSTTGVFNDIGMFIYITTALSSNAKLEVTRILRDWLPATVNLLVMLIGGAWVGAPTYAFPTNTIEIDLTS